MKKVICFVIVLLLFTGCKKSGVPNTSDPINEPAATATALTGETEPDMLETPLATEASEAGETSQTTKNEDGLGVPDITPTATAQNSGSTPTVAPEITSTPNGGVEMPRVPLN